MNVLSKLNKYTEVYPTILSCLGIATLIVPGLGFASNDTNSFNLSEVEEGNYVHFGKHLRIEDEQHDDIANIGFIIGDECIAVIDTGGSVNTGTQLRNKIRSISDKPICYVINTHIHYDHMLGNKAFIAEKPAFVGHQKLAEAVEHNRAFFLEQFKQDLGKNPDNTSIIGPSVLVEQSKEIDLGNRILTLIPFPSSHTHNDLIVIDNKTKTLWAGDLIYRQRIPSLTGDLKGWLKTMDKLQQLEIKTVVPGHGDIARSMTAAIAQQQGYFQRLLDETRKAIADGMFINDATENIDKDNQSNWLLHDYQHPANVSKVYTELEWE